MSRVMRRQMTKARRQCPICKHPRGVVRWWKWRQHQQRHLKKGEHL